MSKEIMPFNFKGNQVRVITDERGEPWWVAKDVCDVLGVKNPSMAISPLDDDEKNTLSLTEGNRGNPTVNIINESGLYAIIIRSDKPQAKPFRKWVTSEVLPSIRKTGRYEIPTQTPATLLPTDREFRAALRMAKAAGLKGNQAVLAANRLAERITGTAPLPLLDISHLESETKSVHMTPSDIGKQFGISGKRVNQMLATMGLQESYRDNRNRQKWRPTPAGEAYAVLKDTGKKNGSGAMVTQLFWLDTVADMVEQELEK